MTFLFTILMMVVFVKLIGLAIKMTWGLFKILMVLIVFPAILISLAVAGLFYIAIPLLVLTGVVSLIKG